MTSCHKYDNSLQVLSKNDRFKGRKNEVGLIFRRLSRDSKASQTINPSTFFTRMVFEVRVSSKSSDLSRYLRNCMRRILSVIVLLYHLIAILILYN